MSTSNARPDEQKLASLLAAYDEALAAGAPPPSADTPVSAEQEQRLQRAQDCLHLLEQLWPRAANEPAAVPALPDAAALPAPFGRFLLLREVGRGGCGVVFAAFDASLNRKVALKLPRPEVLLTPELRRRFVREARAAAGLDHPNIVAVYETGEVGPVAYIAQAYCAGPTLSAWLKRQDGPVPARAAATLVATLADAVQHAHSRGILHRDLKPGNVLLAEGRDQRSEIRGQRSEVRGQRSEGGNQRAQDKRANQRASDRCYPISDLCFPKITDFGLAKILAAEVDTTLRLAGVERPEASDEDATRSGVVVGTPSYMAPEQAEGRHGDIGPATDVYALGAILYELLAGQPPFQGETDAATRWKVATEEPDPPRRLRRGLAPDLETICLKCLSKAPDRRYASAHELAEDLRRFLAGEPIQARPAGPVTRLLKWAQRHPAAALLAGVCGLALVALAVGGFWYQERQRVYRAELEAAALREKERADEAERARQRAQEAWQDTYGIYVRQAHDLWADDRGPLMRAALDRLRPGPDDPDLRGFEWRYLSRLARTDLFRLEGGDCWVGGIRTSPDGRLLAVPNTKNVIELWSLPDHKLITFLEGHELLVSELAFTPNNQFLVSAGGDGCRSEVRVWHLPTRQLHADLSGPELTAHIALSTNGRTLAIGGEIADQHVQVRFHDLATSCEVSPRLRLPGGGNGGHVHFSPNGQRLAVITALGPTVEAVLWDRATRRPLGRQTMNHPNASCLAFAPNGATLATGSADATVKLWDLATGRERATLRGHTFPVSCLAFAPDGRALATASGPVEQGVSSPVRLWDVATGRPQGLLPNRDGGVHALHFAPGGRLLMQVNESNRLRFSDPLAGQSQLALNAHGPFEAWFVAFSPDSKTLASCGDDHNVRLWDPATGKMLRTLTGHDQLVVAVAFSPDGKTLVSGSYDQSVKVWDLKSGKAKMDLSTGPNDRVRSLALSPDGELLAVGSRDRGLVRIWKAGKEVHRLDGFSDQVITLAFSSDGRTLAGQDNHGVIHLWDTAAWRVRQRLTSKDPVWCLAFSPDGKMLAAGTEQGAVRFWDLDGDGAQERTSLLGHGFRVRAVAFAPDGRTLASAAEDRTVKLWQVATGQDLLTLRGHTKRVNSVAFSGDGQYLASADHEGVVRLWRADLPE